MNEEHCRRHDVPSWGTRRTAASFLLALLVAATAQAEQEPERYTGRLEDRARVCMLQDTVQSRDGLEHVYDGKKYYLCCGGCLAGFSGNPEKYSRALDPVNGKTVDKATAPIYAYDGRAYIFSSKATLAAFPAEPEKYRRSGGPEGRP